MNRWTGRSPPGKLHVADMPDDRDKSTNDDATLAVGGVLFVGAPVSGRSRSMASGPPQAGWCPRGIAAMGARALVRARARA